MTSLCGARPRIETGRIDPKGRQAPFSSDASAEAFWTNAYVDFSYNPNDARRGVLHV